MASINKYEDRRYDDAKFAFYMIKKLINFNEITVLPLFFNFPGQIIHVSIHEFGVDFSGGGQVRL